MSHFTTVLKNSSYLMGFKLLSRLLSSAFVIYAATELKPALFGILSFVLVTVDMLNGIGDLGITRYGARELVRRWQDKEVLAGQILLLQLLTSVPFMIVGVALLLVYHPAYPKFQLLLLGLAAFYLFSVIATTESVFTATQKFFYSALFTFIGRLVYMVFGIAVLAAHGSVVLIMAGYLGGVIVETLLRLAMVIWKITGFSFRFPLARLWRMLVIIVPFAIVGIASIFSYRINLVILEFIKGDTATGVFNIAFTLFSPFVWVILIFSTTAFPGFTQIYSRDRDAARRNGWQWYRLMSLGGIPLALFVTLVARSILTHFPAGYQDSAAILIILVWSMPVMLINAVDINILQASDRQRLAANGLVLGAVTTALLSLALIPALGGNGAALASLGSVTVQGIYIHLQVRRHFMKRWVYPLLLRPLAGGIVMGAVALILLPVNVWLAAVAGLGAYAIAVLATGAIRPSEIRSMVRG
ncbi:MAG: flippase [Thermoleophilia bacterium]